jgi:hypothetical protein
VDAIQPDAAAAVVEAYFDALVGHDYERAAALLATDGFRYESPIAKFSRIDDFVQYMSGLGGILHGIERRRVFVDGDDVCHWLVFETQLSERVSTRAVQWTRVIGGRIAFIEVLFDPYRYRLLFEVD